MASQSAFLLRAAAFAAERHCDQRRKGPSAHPYINHPLALADLLANEGGVVDEVTLCAALLHDTLEDTSTTREELAARFGEEVADVVVEVSDDKSLPKQVRKQLQIDHAHRTGDRARLVKLADKICNLRDLAAEPPAGWSEERIAAYYEWTARVVAGLREQEVDGERRPYPLPTGLLAIFDALLER